jgi:predicted MPP superfamily phosphohydrolase
MMNRRTFLKSILYAGGASLAGGSAYALHSVDLEISRQRACLSGLDRKLRVVALSDLHAPCYYISTSDLIRTVNAQKPDVLILAGDMFGVPEFETVIGKFKKTEAGIVKLAVPGNWEYQLDLDPEALKKAYADSGIGYLVNDAFEVGGLKIIGLDDLLQGAPRFKMANMASACTSPLLVIDHCPQGFDNIVPDSRIQKVVISGHTHGGQIAPFGHALVTPPGSGRYVQGWYRRGQNVMYVMRGIGASPHMPIRLGARPELLVLDLIPA